MIMTSHNLYLTLTLIKKKQLKLICASLHGLDQEMLLLKIERYCRFETILLQV